MNCCPVQVWTPPATCSSGSALWTGCSPAPPPLSRGGPHSCPLTATGALPPPLSALTAGATAAGTAAAWPPASASKDCPWQCAAGSVCCLCACGAAWHGGGGHLPGHATVLGSTIAGNSKHQWARHGIQLHSALQHPAAHQSSVHARLEQGTAASSAALSRCRSQAHAAFELPLGVLQVCAWSSRQSGQQGPLGAGQAGQDGLAGPTQQHQQQRSRAAHMGPGPNIQGVST